MVSERAWIVDCPGDNHAALARLRNEMSQTLSNDPNRSGAAPPSLARV